MKKWSEGVWRFSQRCQTQSWRRFGNASKYLYRILYSTSHGLARVIIVVISRSLSDFPHSLKLPRLKVHNPNILNNPIQTLDKGQVLRVLFKVKLPVSLVLELADEAVRETALQEPRSARVVSRKPVEQGKRADYLVSFRAVVPTAAERLHIKLACLGVFAFVGEGDHAVADL